MFTPPPLQQKKCPAPIHLNHCLHFAKKLFLNRIVAVCIMKNCIQNKVQGYLYTGTTDRIQNRRIQELEEEIQHSQDTVQGTYIAFIQGRGA